MEDKQFAILNQQLEKLTSHFVHIDESLSRMDERLIHVDARLVNIEEDQQLIKKAVLDTNERVMKMEAVLENQHRIIELLSARSLSKKLT